VKIIMVEVAVDLEWHGKEERVRLKDIMTQQVKVIHPDAALQEAARQMWGLDIGPLPVCDGEQFVGMLTDCN
jgi:CBS domain-containing protein